MVSNVANSIITQNITKHEKQNRDLQNAFPQQLLTNISASISNFSDKGISERFGRAPYLH